MGRISAPGVYSSSMLQDIISEVNEITGKDGTKKYQEEILMNGVFSILCPIIHQLIYPKFNYIFFPHRSDIPAIIYIFEGAERFALISWLARRGSPIIEAMTKTVSANNHPFMKHVMSGQAINFVRAVLNEPPPSIPKIDLNLKPKLICGKVNFAHFIQSDLPTIDNVIFGEREIDAYITWDPFNLCMKSPYSEKLNYVEQNDAFHGWNSSLVFTGTSTFLPDKVRSRFLNCIINEKSPNSLRIYITVRPSISERFLKNQTDFLCCLIRKFHEKHDDMEFVIDGFSMPEQMCASLHGESFHRHFSELVEQSRLAIRDIIQAIPDIEQKIYNINGMKLSDALEIISGCSYYVCHEGSPQHKIGWLFPRNGFIHSNRWRTSDDRILWYEKQTEYAILPSAPERKYIEDVDTPMANKRYCRVEAWDRKSNNIQIWNKDYIINDINSVSDQIIQDFTRSVMDKF